MLVDGTGSVDAGTAEKKTGVKVQLDSADEVTINVNDPGKLLSAVGATGPARSLPIGVPAPHIFLPATAASDTATGKQFKVYIPFDKDVQVFVASDSLSLLDAKGNALKNGGASIPVNVPHGQGPEALSIAVGGVVAGTPAP
jgi:hypothetical protein